ncbi:MAG TPA: NAD-dependent epimerase/dehydratase family protein [Aquabacterium sp.]|nr:NAD-dependent epimerase/dehydratase family protein [Aquabacterium sp.]
MKIPSILVLGATGGLGGAIAATFSSYGWHVQAMVRRIPVNPPKDLAGVNWLLGDAMNEEDVLAAAYTSDGRPVDFIFHGLNPPKYQRWRELALPMLDHTLTAARRTGASVLFPGNIYNYSPDVASPISEHAPQVPQTRKGQVRVEMEERLKQASQQGVRVRVVRAGDFFGRAGPSNWFSTVMIKPNQPVERITLLSDSDVGHAWAYLPDLAEAFYRLAKAESQLGAFEAFHFQGHWIENDAHWVSALKHVTGRANLKVRHLPWRWIAWMAPWIGLMREIHEMRYLWRTALALDNRKLVSFIGTEPHTPLEQALRQALSDQGSLFMNPRSGG